MGEQIQQVFKQQVTETIRTRKIWIWDCGGYCAGRYYQCHWPSGHFWGRNVSPVLTHQVCHSVLAAAKLNMVQLYIFKGLERPVDFKLG